MGFSYNKLRKLLIDKNMKKRLTMCNSNNSQDNSQDGKRWKCKFRNIREDLWVFSMLYWRYYWI